MFTRESVAAGMPARRASTLLFAIENRSALMAARARRAMASFETEHTVAERERKFLGALADGRTPPLKPTIQDIDRHAPDWRDLVPPDAATRAALLARFATKYGLPPQARAASAALGADDPAVRSAYEKQGGTDLEALRSTPLPRRERLRWLRDRLSRRVEALPPFWLAFALTLTETVGVGVLALPIAFAGFGPVGGAALLAGFGILNVITVAALCEAITRNGHFRYGLAYFGRLVGDYLGRPGNALAMPALFLLQASGLVVCLVGFGSTMSAFTGLPVVLPIAALFAAVALILWRDSLNVTVTVAVALGLVNLSLLLAMTAIALASPAAPAGDVIPLGAGITLLELIFGVGLGAYFGHTAAGYSAKVVLAQDPGGKQFLAGNVAAMLTAIVVYVLFVAGVTSAVGAGALAGYDGTALVPLAERLGPAIAVMGGVYIVPTMVLGAMYCALALYNQMGELLYGAPQLGRRLEAAGRAVGFAVRASPAIAIFGLVLILLQVGRISLTQVLAIVGTLTMPLMGGVFPMLLVLAARRRGERVPSRVVGALGQPAIAGAVGMVFLLGVAVFGLWIWTDPLQRLAAIVVSLGIVALVAVSLRRGAFRPRTVVEYRVEVSPPAVGIVSVVSGGRTLPATIHVRDAHGERTLAASGVVDSPDRVRSIGVDLPAAVAPELLVWVHNVTADGSSTETSARVDVAVGDAPSSRMADSLDHLRISPGDRPTRLTLSISGRPGAP